MRGARQARTDVFADGHACGHRRRDGSRPGAGGRSTGSRWSREAGPLPNDFGDVAARGETGGKAGHREIAVLGRRRGRSSLRRPAADCHPALPVQTRLAARILRVDGFFVAAASSVASPPLSIASPRSARRFRGSSTARRLREGHDFSFGLETSAEVRNVADPIRLRALLEPRACTAGIAGSVVFGDRMRSELTTIRAFGSRRR